MVDSSAEVLTATRFHEAGHAVMAFWSDVPIKGITVVADDAALGHVAHYSPGRWFRPDLDLTPRVLARIDAHVRIGLAGKIAQTIHAESLTTKPRNWRANIRHGAEHDMHNVVNLAVYRTQAVAEYIAWMEVEVRATMQARWRQVTLMADALAGQPVMTGDQARSALVDASRLSRQPTINGWYPIYPVAVVPADLPAPLTLSAT